MEGIILMQTFDGEKKIDAWGDTSINHKFMHTHVQIFILQTFMMHSSQPYTKKIFLGRYKNICF